MTSSRATRGADTARGIFFLLRLQWVFRAKGQRAAALLTRDAMRVKPASQADLDVRNIDAWHTARAIWRAKRWLPVHSTCLQTALATQMLFRAKGVPSAVRLGVRDLAADAHAWVEVGDFVLDDQRLSAAFLELRPAKQREEESPV